MKLHKPFVITPRLLPGVKIGDAFISIAYSRHGGDGSRMRYEYHIDLADGQTYTADDLQSGCGGGTLQAGMGSLLAFLGACAEAVQYAQRQNRESENQNLFPAYIGEWAAQHSDEIASVQAEIEESDFVGIDE